MSEDMENWGRGDLPVPIDSCNSVTHRYSEGRVECERLTGHDGNHQRMTGGPGFTGGVVWSSGFSIGISADAVPCGGCGTNNNPGSECSFCRVHYAWLDSYAAGTLIVANGVAYKRDRMSGAFGNAQITVRMNDGRVYGPDSSTWHLGDVPHEYRELMSDNAVLDWGIGR